MKAKRKIQNPEDIYQIQNVENNSAAGAKKVIIVQPVPKRTLAAGDHKLGLGKLVMLTAAGYTLKDSNAVKADLIVPASVAPVGSVVSLGPDYDTINCEGFELHDDSKIDLSNAR